ncbi:Uncharacterized protein At1g26090, chloroplastic [Linum grandiflorum]
MRIDMTYGIVFDETLRMISAASKARLYLKYVRNMAEKTDLGRLVTPSVLRLLDEASLNLTDRRSFLNGRAFYRGGSELLVEAGHQRRVIALPPKISRESWRCKVHGDKFGDHNVITYLLSRLFLRT